MLYQTSPFQNYDIEYFLPSKPFNVKDPANLNGFSPYTLLGALKEAQVGI